MSRRSIGWKNLWSLTVLVFLRLRPMHPYQLQSVIKLTHKEDFLRLKSGSLYNAIERLLEAGLIEVAQTTRDGRRPERTVYRITKEGVEEMIHWLRELLENPGPDSTWFYAALSFLPALEPQDVLKQLRKRVANLETEVQNYKSVLTELMPKIGRIPLIEVEYALASREAERQWVARIIRDLQNGKLNWNQETVRKHAAQLFCEPGPGGNRKRKEIRKR